MARGKKKEKEFTPEEKLQRALVPVDEWPYEIPENWCWVRIGEITDVVGGGTPSYRNPEFYDGGTIPWISPADLSGYRDIYISHGAKSITEKGLEKSSAKLLPPDTVCLSSRAPIGYVVIAQNSLATNQGFKSFLPSPTYNPQYLYWYLKSNKELLESKASGTTFLELSGSKAAKVEFPLPPLPEQHRIVVRIESLFVKLDEAKEKAQAVVDGFEDRKAAILHKAFTGELTSIKNADSINYVLSEIRKWSVTFPAKDIKAIEKEQEKASIICLPDGRNWIKCTVGAIGRVTNGSTPSRKCSDYWNGNIPWVSSGEVRNNTIYITNECITQKGFDNSSVKLLPKGTILIAMIGEGKTRGQSAILEIEATINQNIAAIVIDHGLVEPEFLWFWFQMNYKKNREKGSGSGPQALNCQRVRELDCICPSIKEQREIVTLLRALILKEEQVNENAEHVIELIDNIKKSILARAFRGELGTNDPTDESAEKLLKRILI